MARAWTGPLRCALQGSPVIACQGNDRQQQQSLKDRYASLVLSDPLSLRRGLGGAEAGGSRVKVGRTGQQPPAFAGAHPSHGVKADGRKGSGSRM